jgi:hypothetical protein
MRGIIVSENGSEFLDAGRVDPWGVSNGQTAANIKSPCAWNGLHDVRLEFYLSCRYRTSKQMALDDVTTTLA